MADEQIASTPIMEVELIFLPEWAWKKESSSEIDQQVLVDTNVFLVRGSIDTSKMDQDLRYRIEIEAKMTGDEKTDIIVLDLIVQMDRNLPAIRRPWQLHASGSEWVHVVPPEFAPTGGKLDFYMMHKVNQPAAGLAIKKIAKIYPL